MSIDDLITPGRERADDRPSQLLTGTVLDSATALTDLIRVRLGEDTGQYIGPMTFVPGAVLPNEGDRCLVAFTDRGEPWIVAWETEEGLPAGGGGAPSGPAGGVLSGTYPNPGFAADMATQAELDTAIGGRQPLDSDLTAIAALSTTSFGRALLELANAAALLSAAGAAAASHTHAQADVTNLVTDLAGKQPLDSDLTAIAALATTSFGRSLLTQADAAAVRGLIDAASNSVESWTNVSSFLNSWVNFGGTDLVAAYYKDPWNVVHLRGVIKSGTVGSPAFTLPAGYRPPGTMRFAVDANGAFGYVAVTSAGNVTPAAGSNAEVNLAGISFRNQ